MDATRPCYLEYRIRSGENVSLMPFFGNYFTYSFIFAATFFELINGSRGVSRGRMAFQLIFEKGLG